MWEPRPNFETKGDACWLHVRVADSITTQSIEPPLFLEFLPPPLMAPTKLRASSQGITEGRPSESFLSLFLPFTAFPSLFHVITAELLPNKRLSTAALRAIIGIFMVEKANTFNTGKSPHAVHVEDSGKSKRWITLICVLTSLMAEQMVQLSYIRLYWSPGCLTFMPLLLEVDHRAGDLHSSPAFPGPPVPPPHPELARLSLISYTPSNLSSGLNSSTIHILHVHFSERV